MGLYKPHSLGFLAKILRAEIFPLSGFKKKFLKEFKDQKDFIYLFSRVLKNQRKIGFWDIALVLQFYHIASIFSKIFLCVLISKYTLISTLELYLLS